VLVLVEPLVLPQMGWRVSVFAERHGLVVQRHPGDGVAPASWAGWSRAPGVPTKQWC
jgi:hypothetical protein